MCASSEQGEQESLSQLPTKTTTNQAEEGDKAHHQAHRLEMPADPVPAGIQPGAAVVPALSRGQPRTRGPDTATLLARRAYAARAFKPVTKAARDAILGMGTGQPAPSQLSAPQQ